MHKDQKIAIIGAGPSGIITAYFLNKYGYTNIYLYGDIGECQAKTIRTENVYSDVGTCYAHTGYYNSIKKLLEEFDTKQIYLDPPQEMNSDDNLVKPNEDPSVLSKLKIAYFLLHGLGHKFLKNTFLSKYIYSSDFETYLKNVGLGSLATKDFILTAGGVSQGYGFLDEVSAYHLFQWFRPSIFLTPILNKQKKGTSAIEGGYGEFFKKIYNSLNCKKYINKITRVDKNIITTDIGEKIYFDHIFICCPIHQITTPLKITEYIEHSKVFSYLWSSSDLLSNLQDRVYIKDLINNKTRNKILSFRIWGQKSNNEYIYWAFGMTDETIIMEELRNNIKEQLANMNIRVDQELFFSIYDYNYRFTEDAIKKGIHLQVEKEQGVDNIWYLGGLMSHWDVDSIYEQSKEIVNKFIIKESTGIEKVKSYFRNKKQFWFETW